MNHCIEYIFCIILLLSVNTITYKYVLYNIYIFTLSVGVLLLPLDIIKKKLFIKTQYVILDCMDQV